MGAEQLHVVVRIATRQDAAELARLIGEFDGEALSAAELLKRMQAVETIETLFFAELQGHAVGLASLHLAPSVSSGSLQGELTELLVEAGQAKGEIEALLLGSVEAEAKRRGARHLRLLTGLRNPEAQQMYRKLGYQDYALAMRKLL